MSWVRFAGFAISAAAAVAAPLWLTSGCSSASNFGGGTTADAGPKHDSGKAPGDGGHPGSGSGSGSGTGTGTGSGSGSGSASGSGSGTGACTTNTGPITGTVGPSGGSISRLVFGVVGDTRPANEDDPSSYPTSVIGPIYQDIEAL